MKKKLNEQAEKAKRGAAAQAHSTKGRSRTFEDKTKYNRKTQDWSEATMTPEEYYNKEIEILANIPSELHSALSYHAYQKGHSGGYENILVHLQDIVEILEKPVQELINRVVSK